MAKKRGKSVSKDTNNHQAHGVHLHKSLPERLPPQKLTFGQKAADKLAEWAGSWVFIILFMGFLIVWMIINAYVLFRMLGKNPFDPYPFILLNLILSCLAAIQAPIILMSQNREAERERIKTERDHIVNRKAEREIQQVQKDIEYIKNNLINKIKKR